MSILRNDVSIENNVVSQKVFTIAEACELGKANMTEEKFNEWKRTIQPCLAFVDAHDLPLMGWLGGNPILGEGEEWPVGQQGALSHLLTINCEVAHILAGDDMVLPLPAKGHVSFFVYLDRDFLSFDFAEPENVHIVWSENGVETKVLADVPTYDRIDISGVVSASIDMLKIYDYLDVSRVEATGQQEGFVEELYERLTEKYGQIGGIPVDWQGDVMEEFAEYSVPVWFAEDTWWEGLEKSDIMAKLRFVLSVDSQGGIMIADGGMVLWALKEEDLIANRWEKAICCLQAG